MRKIGKHQMFLNSLGNIFASRLGKQILFPQQCFHGWANRETFEETSRITNVSTTMFPSLPRALYLQVINTRKQIKTIDGLESPTPLTTPLIHALPSPLPLSTEITQLFNLFSQLPNQFLIMFKLYTCVITFMT